MNENARKRAAIRDDEQRAAVRALWNDYHARMGQWIPTLKVGDRVGLTDRLVHCDRTRAALGTVRSITPTGRINVDVDGWEHPVTYTRKGVAYSKWRTFGFLELPEMLTKLIEDIAEYDRLLAERAALRKAWFEQLGWDTKTANLFRTFTSAVDHGHEVTDEMRTAGAGILRVLVAMGIAPVPVDERPAVRGLLSDIARLSHALDDVKSIAEKSNAAGDGGDWALVLETLQALNSDHALTNIRQLLPNPLVPGDTLQDAAFRDAEVRLIAMAESPDTAIRREALAAYFKALHDWTGDLVKNASARLRQQRTSTPSELTASVRERILHEEITRLRVALHQTVTAARFPDAPDAWDQVRDAGAALEEDRRVLLVPSTPLHTSDTSSTP